MKPARIVVNALVVGALGFGAVGLGGGVASAQPAAIPIFGIGVT